MNDIKNQEIEEIMNKINKETLEQLEKATAKNNLEFTSNKLQQLIDGLRQSDGRAKNREEALAITKMEEAVMWLERSANEAS